nr:male-killing protein 1 [Drosophila biauraria male killing partitivirus 1]
MAHAQASNDVKPLTEREARDVWFGTFDLIYHEFSLLERYGFDVTAELPRPIRSAWIYAYRATNIVFVAQKVLGGPAHVMREIRHHRMNSNTICDLIDIHKDTIIAQLKSKAVKLFASDSEQCPEADEVVDIDSSIIEEEFIDFDTLFAQNADEMAASGSERSTCSEDQEHPKTFDCVLTDTVTEASESSEFIRSFEVVPIEYTSTSIVEIGNPTTASSQQVPYRPIFQTVIFVDDQKLYNYLVAIGASHWHYDEKPSVDAYLILISKHVNALSLSRKSLCLMFSDQLPELSGSKRLRANKILVLDRTKTYDDISKGNIDRAWVSRQFCEP